VHRVFKKSSWRKVENTLDSRVGYSNSEELKQWNRFFDTLPNIENFVFLAYYSHAWTREFDFSM